jgi:hypothetical protein
VSATDRLSLLVAVAVASAGGSSISTARADGSDRCLAAPVEGQKLQRAGKLLDARDRFATCATNTCPAEVVENCMRWLRQVDDELPSVVVAARDPKGRDLTDVRVSIDGKAATEMSTRAVRLDPGPHTFVFRQGGSADQEQQVIVRDGEKNRQVVATFGVLPLTPTPAPALRTAERPVPVGVWVAGGLGAVGLVSFAVSGTLGVAQRDADHCDTGCPPADKSAVDAKYLVANVSLGLGVAALAVATVLYLARPTVEPLSSAAASWPGFVGLRF